MEIISVHVPKTAGIVFGKILDNVYGESAVVKDYESFDIRSFRPEHCVVHGHFAVSKYHGLFPEAKRVAFIRHPVSWVISLYHFSKHVTRRADWPVQCRLIDEGLSLLEFAEHPMTRNNYANIFFYGLEVEQFYFVGIHEHFADEVKHLGHMLGWPDTRVMTDNANPEPGYSDLVRGHMADKAVVKKLEEYMANDLAVYERAVKLRARRARRADTGRRTFSGPWGLFASARSRLRA